MLQIGFYRLIIVAVLFATFCPAQVVAQSFRFALVTDTHVGGSTGLEDLERTVLDINANPDIAFALFSGDITEFGSDEEIVMAKTALDQLNKPWYVVPGNHDTNWSESGGNTFLNVFGAETFSFTHEGFLFVGTNSGPNMRMSPGQIPRENLVWLDSVLAEDAIDRKPIIYINHYPQDTSLNNWFEAIDRLKEYNIQLALCGHGHSNRLYDFEGIPGVMNRSNLRARDSVGAYNIISISEDKAIFTLRYPGVKTETESWLHVPLVDHAFDTRASSYPRPDYTVNDVYAEQIKVSWDFQDNSDVGAGLSTHKNKIITANTAGQVYALNSRTGEKMWSFQTDGKIYSTPMVWRNYVMVGSADHWIYVLNARNGKLLWKYETDKAVLGTPVIHKGIGYIGGSDGSFRAFSMKNGKLLWEFDGIKGYISAQPLIYGDHIYFGSWGNDFYALDLKTGQKRWEWSNGSSNRMLSAAACYPVASGGRIFLVAPDRHMTALDAATGEEIWREMKPGVRVRESMGISEKGDLVYVKTMEGELLGVSTAADSMDVVWRSALQLPYELTPSAIQARDGLVFVPSHSGLLSAVNASSGAVIWQHKISNGMINPVLTMKGKAIVASTMDGKITKLEWNSVK